MNTLSHDSEIVARDWLCESQGDPTTAALRYGVRMLLENAESEAERLRLKAVALGQQVVDQGDKIERLRAELVSIHRAVGTLVSSCIDGQNELHGIKYGGPAKRTLRGIEGTLETIARKAAEAAGEE